MNQRLLMTAVALAALCAPVHAEVIEQNGVRYNVDYVTVYKDPKPGWEIVQALQGHDRLSSFRDAVEKVGLTRPLDTEEGFTAFVPVNQTFQHQGLPTDFYTEGNTVTSKLISGHVVNQKINVHLIHGTYERVESISGTTLTLHRVGDNVTVNGKRIIDSDKTPYGFIYYVDDFIEEPAAGAATAPAHPATAPFGG